jgi:hypothetical protein
MELTKTIARQFSWFKNIPLLPILIDEQIKVFTLFFRPSTFQRMIRFNALVKSFGGVTANYHRYGGIEFRIANKEICHMHGDGLVDLLISRKIKEEFGINSELEPHHVHPNTGWVSVSLSSNKAYALTIQVAKSAYQMRQ